MRNPSVGIVQFTLRLSSFHFIPFRGSLAYHWVINPSVKQRYGNDFVKKVQVALLKLNPNVPEQKEILDLFGAQKFIATQNSNYTQIETVGREIGKIK